MEPYTIHSDIQIMYLTAKKFPNDIPDAYKKLEEIIIDKSERRYFGYSQTNRDGAIVYKACAEILNNYETHNNHLETLNIMAGTYASIYIANHFNDSNNIPNAFEQLLNPDYALEVRSETLKRNKI